MYWLVTWSRYFYEKFVIIIDRKWWTLLTHYSNHRVETVKQEIKWSEILFCSESPLSGTDQKAGVKTTVMKGHYTQRHLLLISKHDTDHFILHKSGQINILLTVSPSCPWSYLKVKMNKDFVSMIQLIQTNQWAAVKWNTFEQLEIVFSRLQKLNKSYQTLNTGIASQEGEETPVGHLPWKKSLILTIGPSAFIDLL